MAGVRLIQLPGICYLEVIRQPKEGGTPITMQEELLLSGLATPETPALDDLRANEALARSLDEYDWIVISNLFSAEVAEKIARGWEQPSGKLERKQGA